MKTLGLLGSSALRSAAFIALAASAATPAFAQDDATAAGDDSIATQEVASSDEGDAAIVVTGSRIRRPNLESTIPITSISGDEFFTQGQNNVGDTLNELPQLRATRQQNNSNLGIGIAGLNLLDLRGLGTQRTLVLVNGRRHVAADILNNAVSPDINTIPNDLVERVDIVTGGNSAIYGSDAIAGVVNFVLRRDFEGLQIRGNTGISEAGYGANYYMSAMYGMNFGDGRGNVTLHGEYAHQDRVYGFDIPFIRRNSGLFVTDVDGAGLPEGSDGIPDRTFIRDVRSTTISPYGLVPVTQPRNAPGCGLGIPSGTGAQLAYNCTYVFLPDGTLVPQTGTRFGAGITGGVTGGNGPTGREGNQITMFPEQDRYNFNLLAHYTVSDAFEPFVEAKFVRVNSRGSNPGGFGIQGITGTFDGRQRTRLDNPFLSAQARATLTTAILASGCNTDLQVACDPTAATPTGVLTAAQRAAIADGSYRFALARTILDAGPRSEEFQRDTYRAVVGFRGNFNEDWNYEISANYGRMEEDTLQRGFVDVQRFQLALDAGRNPVTGQIQCRAQFDPASAVARPNTPANAARLAADIAACVPYNPFGQANNRASADYFSYNARNRAEMTQFVVNAFMSGDSSQLFELPGGPVRFALGAEYRRETAFFDNDDFVENGNTNAVVIGTFDPPAFEVKEAFLELQLPILANVPFFEELTISGAARVADYRGATGTVFAYNAGADWSPVRGLRFRGNYGRSVRAPNYSETGFPIVPNFAPGFQDPCRANNIGSGSQFRAANCAADLGALLNDPTFANQGNISLNVLSGSNADLREETSDSITLGAVIQPMRGVSFSVDYYDITVNDVIVAPTAQQIANSCYDLPDLNNPFCALFDRYRGAAPGPLGEITGQIRGNSLQQIPVNFAKRVRRGIDFELAVRHNVSEDVRLDSRLLYTHNLQQSNFEDPTRPNFENRILGELGNPVDEFRWDISLTHGAFTVGYQLSYIGSMWVNFYEDFNSLQGRPPQDSDYSDIPKFPSVVYHDIRFEWNVPRGGGNELNFFFGVDNLFDRDPPLGAQGNGERGAAGGTGTSIYNVRGRNFFAGFRARF